MQLLKVFSVIFLILFLSSLFAWSQADSDNDGIPDDGDNSGVIGDNPCTGGETENCDDNCRWYNPDQADGDGDGIGDVCDDCCDTPGDANNNYMVSILDITYLIAFLYKGGPEPPCLDEGEPTAIVLSTFWISHITLRFGIKAVRLRCAGALLRIY